MKSHGVSAPSQSETLADIFRQEALDHRARATTRLGEPLRSSAPRLQAGLWALAGVMVLCLALAGTLTVDDIAAGPAVVIASPPAWNPGEPNRTTGGASWEGSGVAVSCRWVGYVPARHLPVIRPGTKARLALGSGKSVSFDVELDETDPHLISTERVRELLHDPAFFGSGPMIEVAGHFESGAERAASNARERGASQDDPRTRLECPSGSRGTIEVPLPPRSLLSVLVPESAASSEGSR